ncbi:MAG: response regulator [SAR202 cluster bacterium]|nr:response regulator [SAR202 cluster bacterium]
MRCGPRQPGQRRKAAQRAQMEIAGEVGYRMEAVTFAKSAGPDIILLTAEEPASRALETAEALTNILPATPIIICSSNNSPEAVRRALVLGARDYLLKPLQAGQLLEAVKTVMAQDKQRQMRREGQLPETEVRGMVITVTGGKGGIGKSVTSVNLSLALRRETGRSVAMVDADTHFGDVATLMDLTDRNKNLGTLLPVLEQVERHNVHEFLTPHSSGVRVLITPTDREVWENCSPDSLKRIISLLALTHDFVVVDTSGSFDKLVRACIEVSTLTLMVTTGEVYSVRDTAAAVRRLAAWGVGPERFKVLLNRTTPRDGIRREDLKAAINHDIFWEIPYDRKVPNSVQLGQPVLLEANRSKAALSYTLLAHSIGGKQRAAERRRGVPVLGGLLQWRRPQANKLLSGASVKS